MDDPTSSPSEGRPLGVCAGGTRHSSVPWVLVFPFPCLTSFLCLLFPLHLPNESPAPGLGLQGRFRAELKPKKHIHHPHFTHAVEEVTCQGDRVGKWCSQDRIWPGPSTPFSRLCGLSVPADQDSCQVRQAVCSKSWGAESSPAQPGDSLNSDTLLAQVEASLPPLLSGSCQPLPT